MNIDLNNEQKEYLKKVLLRLAKLKHKQSNGSNFFDFNFTDLLYELEKEGKLKRHLTAHGSQFFYNDLSIRES